MTEREQRNVGVIEGGDFFAAMMSNGGLSFEEKLSIILDLLLGGYETTATLLSLVVYFLGHAPNALETLKVCSLSASLTRIHTYTPTQ